ncbi:MAG: SDR family NAD(P)-dependent oxidoreductase [Spirochaetia bacterium]|nr:SDR family NAD(P)-dependent oxidoreductase [Spirochaetia bacterium]
MKTAVVTGVSTGIGLSTTKALIGAGYRVLGCVRKKSDAEHLSGLLGPAFSPLLFDVTESEKVRLAADYVRLELRGEPLSVLVNNAGIVIDGPLLGVPLERFRLQLEVNVLGVFLVTQTFAPLLGASKNFSGTPGRIIIVGSTVGRVAAPLFGPYSASKFALEGFADSLRRELMLYGIDVILVGPGPVATPIMAKKPPQPGTGDYDAAIEKYESITAKLMRNALPPEKVSRLFLKILAVKKPRTRYTIIPGGILSFLILILPIYLPKRIVDRMFAGMLGLTPRKQRSMEIGRVKSFI